MRTILLFLFCPIFMVAQDLSIPLSREIFDFAKRHEIISGLEIHSSLNEFSSKQVFKEILDKEIHLGPDSIQALKFLRSYPEFWSSLTQNRDSITKEFIDSTKTFFRYSDQLDNTSNIKLEREKPFLKYFYKNPEFFFVYNSPSFLIKLNPIIDFSFGRDFDSEETLFNNTRGIEFSGHIDKKVFFYSRILENQSALPAYIDRFIINNKSLPGQGLYKIYNSSIFGDKFGYDYQNAQAHITTNLTKHIRAEFGNGRHFLGNGIRSMMLSDLSNNYLYLKFNTKVWKLHYQNLFTEMIPVSFLDNPGDSLISRKYTATHILSFKHKNIEISLFETSVFARDNGFEFNYLNPIILYRSVEHNLDSSDNILAGINIKYNLGRTAQLYSQFILDEFKLDELIIERNGWWANKYGFQIGGRYLNAFNIPMLDLLAEYNLARPFTYGHGRPYTNYSHINMPLAHPLGANFDEFLFSIKYNFKDKIYFQSRNHFIRQGLDLDNLHYGSNILRPTTERVMDYNNSLLQGDLSFTFLSSSRISYKLFENYFVDLNVLYRNQNSDSGNYDLSELYFSLGFRMNHFSRPQLF